MAQAKNTQIQVDVVSSRPPTPSAEATITPATASVASMTAALTACWPLTRHGCLRTPSSLAHAITEPDRDTAPINPPSRVTMSWVVPCVRPPNNSTAAIEPAAPPPMPL